MMNECKNCKYAIPFPKKKGYACKKIEAIEKLSKDIVSNNDMDCNNDFCEYFEVSG